MASQDPFSLLLAAPVHFARRPIDIPAELRPAWRGAFLLLALAQCRGTTASVETLHFLNWAVGTRESREAAVRALGSQATRGDLLPVRFDPAVSRALGYLTAEGLVALDRGRYVLQSNGKSVVSTIQDDAAVFAVEKAFFKAIGPLNESRIRRVFKEGNSHGAEHRIVDA